MYIRMQQFIYQEVSQNPQIKVPYPPLNGGQQRSGTLVAFVCPSVTFIYLIIIWSSVFL